MNPVKQEPVATEDVCDMADYLSCAAESQRVAEGGGFLVPTPERLDEAAAMLRRKLVPTFDSAALVDFLKRSPELVEFLRSAGRQEELDAARLEFLRTSLYLDGYGYWLPDLCVKVCGVKAIGEDNETPEPTLDEFRAAIDLEIAASKSGEGK